MGRAFSDDTAQPWIGIVQLHPDERPNPMTPTCRQEFPQPIEIVRIRQRQRRIPQDLRRSTQRFWGRGGLQERKMGSDQEWKHGSNVRIMIQGS